MCLLKNCVVCSQRYIEFQLLHFLLQKTLAFLGDKLTPQSFLDGTF